MNKVTVFLVTLYSFTLLTCSTRSGILPENIPAMVTMQRSGKLVIYSLEEYQMTIVKIPEITAYKFLQNPGNPLDVIAADNDYSLVVNGSYFDYASQDSVTRADLTFLHAGYLKIQDSIYADIMEQDRQLSTLFAYDFESHQAGYFKLDELDQTEAYDLVIQTGPQIIQDSKIQYEKIRRSLNGLGQHARTAFATVNGTEHYIIVTRKTMISPGMNLEEVGQVLLNTGIFNGNLNVVNLDGGSSTSLYLKNHPELSFQSGRQVLPALLCVK